MRLFCTKNHKVSEDNIVLNTKNGQIRVLQKVIEDQIQVINELSTAAAAKQKDVVENRLLDLAESFLIPNKKPISPRDNSAPQLESGVQFTDQEIRENLGKVPTSILQRLRKDETKFKNAVKGQIPNISTESLDKAFVISQEL